jgi:hypothetical protein
VLRAQAHVCSEADGASAASRRGLDALDERCERLRVGRFPVETLERVEQVAVQELGIERLERARLGDEVERQRVRPEREDRTALAGHERECLPKGPQIVVP